MIHSAYGPDGKPALRRPRVECDRCHNITDLAGSEEWLIPIHKQMRDYCPLCEYDIAEQLLRSAAPLRTRLLKLAKSVLRVFN